MLTGLYPFEHGLRKNGQHLDEKLLTMADLLEQSGFETAAFASVKFLQRILGRDTKLEGQRAIEDLNMSYRSLEETLLDSARSMFDLADLK